MELAVNHSEILPANQIMPAPCPFLIRKFPVCSIIRPARSMVLRPALNAITMDGLFPGQNRESFDRLET